MKYWFYTKKEIKQKISWVKNNEDINTEGETEEFREGFVAALHWILSE